jgi:hypothetical protein
MKRLVLATGLIAAFACSQLTALAEDAIATVPFDFRMGTKTLPAGEYVIHESGRVLLIRGRNVSGGALMLTVPESRKAATSQGALVFTVYGDTHFLTRYWAPRSTAGFAVPKSAQEKELARRISRDGVLTARVDTK